MVHYGKGKAEQTKKVEGRTGKAEQERRKLARAKKGREGDTGREEEGDG